MLYIGKIMLKYGLYSDPYFENNLRTLKFKLRKTAREYIMLNNMPDTWYTISSKETFIQLKETFLCMQIIRRSKQCVDGLSEDLKKSQVTKKTPENGDESVLIV